ncbi:hypothetical protein ACFQT0_17880 [Hymenobacter humi]|uniref:Uncharacterized protein n=1 Tax=Hymenobacter humi TaxID=1411620 RepID=A0ABW2U6A4_9BACT
MRYKNISKVQVSVRSKNKSSQIRDTKLVKVLGGTIIDIPELPHPRIPSTLPNREAIIRAQKSGRLRDYLCLSKAWFPASQIPSYEYALSEYVGNTGRSESERCKGQELKCLVRFEDSSLDKIDYVFTAPPKLSYQSEMGVSYDFYLITKQVEAELEADFKRLAIKHPGFLQIDLLINLFDDSLITTLKNLRSENDCFSRKSGLRFRYDYLSSGQMVAKSDYGHLLYHCSSELALGLPNKDKTDSSLDMCFEREEVLRRGFTHGPVSYSYSRKIEYCESRADLFIDNRSKKYVSR